MDENVRDMISIEYSCNIYILCLTYCVQRNLKTAIFLRQHGFLVMLKLFESVLSTKFHFHEKIGEMFQLCLIKDYFLFGGFNKP